MAKDLVTHHKHHRLTIFEIISIAVVVLVGLYAAWLLVGSITTSLQQSANGPVIAWGSDEKGQLGMGRLTGQNFVDEPVGVIQTDLVAVAAGLRHSLGITADGKVYSWGSNTYGQLGTGAVGGLASRPTEIKNLPPITQIAARQDHSLALDRDGTVWAWGLNMSSQLGDKTHTNRPTPRQVAGLTDVTFIATGYRSSLAIKKDGTVWAWGGFCDLSHRSKNLLDYVTDLSVNGYSDARGGAITHITPQENCLYEDFLNVKSPTPMKMHGLPPIVSASVGWGHVLALTKDGDLWSWGCNMYGQVGSGQADKDAIHQPVKIEGIGKIAAASAGFRHSLALNTEGKLYAWGHNYFGELGIGGEFDESIHAVPTEVSSTRMMRIFAGHDYSLALDEKGMLYAWGQNRSNQLVTADRDEALARSKPFQTLVDYRFSDISSGGGHVIALTR